MDVPHTDQPRARLRLSYRILLRTVTGHSILAMWRLALTKDS